MVLRGVGNTAARDEHMVEEIPGDSARDGRGPPADQDPPTGP